MIAIHLRIVGQPVVRICAGDSIDSLMNVIYDLWDILYRTRQQGCVEVRVNNRVFRFEAHDPSFNLDLCGDLERCCKGG